MLNAYAGYFAKHKNNNNKTQISYMGIEWEVPLPDMQHFKMNGNLVEKKRLRIKKLWLGCKRKARY